MKSFCAAFLVLIVSTGFSIPAFTQDWNYHIVDDNHYIGYRTQIVATSDGTPYILYKDRSFYYLYLAHWVSAGGDDGYWDRMLIDQYTRHSDDIEMLCDANDHLHMAWSNYSPSPSVNYAVYDTDTETWIIPEEVVASKEASLDLAIYDDEGTIIPSIALINRDGDLEVMTRDMGGGTWSVEYVYDYSSVLYTPSIAADTSGYLHVSFYDNSGANLMYATNANVTETWTYEYVDITGTVGTRSSIVVDEGNIPYIVYYDVTNGDLKYAKLISE